MTRSKKSTIAGWGNYPKQTAYLYRPEKKQELQDLLASNSQPNYIARGLGRSYGDTALNRDSGLILTTPFNRFLSFDAQTQILECEAGVSFAEILDVFLPRGYFLPVTPGTKFVTVGGAIANDVHGKNHHKDGAICDHILDFQLLTASGDILTCSRDENPDVFWATIGGIGLTGIILSARMKLLKVESAYINVDYKKAANIGQALEMLRETNDQYQYSVAWIDCIASGRSLGRSVLMLGNHAAPAHLPKDIHKPLYVKQKRKLDIPIDFPSFALNPLSIKAFNELYYSRFQDNSNVIVDYDSFFYPLDSILNWNRMYGKKGFIQYQVVFPLETSLPGLTRTLEILSKTGTSSFLAVLKSFGEQGNGYLSFPHKGYTLALDIPVKGQATFDLVRELDQVVLQYGGRIYLAKDSVLAPESLPEMYPDLAKFREIKHKLDPHNLFSSSMARRLRIVEDPV